MTLSRTVTALGAALIVLGSTGCGGGEVRLQTTALSGTVTVDGKPIGTGTVTAYRGGSKVMETAIEAGGYYGFPNPPSGEYQLTVTNVGPLYRGRPVQLPARYADPGASGLSASVTPDQLVTQNLPLRTR